MENLRNIAKNIVRDYNGDLKPQKENIKKAIEDFSSELNSMDPNEIRDNFNDIRPLVFKVRGMKQILIAEGLYKEEDIKLDISLYEAIRTKIKISKI